ncbi:eukaryotic translation initiation factor 3 subunit K-like [Sinocyclocheilus grahami]|uniref:eukaryotic translation initiation factor 3 subunit K-like n=1 Tax=Sinocyclocheilus grahami TaxID=75366 RepID=UPI0007AC8200|nr:PREDICTED: eukaryotic translation initiation factor 3 subunit K-like [Sinocyclocheilus grahami]
MLLDVLVGFPGVSLTAVSQQEERPIRQILYLGNLLETCHFQSFWVHTRAHTHILSLTHSHTHDDVCLTADTQVKVWMNKYGWTENEDGQIFIHNQEESVKPKNIVEKIDFESVSSIMATSQ